MHFLTLFSFFANNSRMKQPTPVFLSYMDFPYAIEGGSTKKNFWVLNKLYMAKREAILKLSSITLFLTVKPSRSKAGYCYVLQYICILVAVECNLFKNNYGIISGSVCAINAVTIRKGDQSLVIEHFKAVFQLLSSLIAYETYIKCHEM